MPMSLQFAHILSHWHDKHHYMTKCWQFGPVYNFPI